MSLLAIVAIVRGADILFIEAAFADADAALAAERAHLTTHKVGRLRTPHICGVSNPFISRRATRARRLACWRR